MILPAYYTPETSGGGSPSSTGQRAVRGALQGPDRASRRPRGVMAVPDDAVLVLVDVQRAFERPLWHYWCPKGGSRNNPDAEQVASRLLAAWRATGRPVIHVQHDSTSLVSPLRARTPTADFSALVQPRDGEPIYHKHGDSAFLGTTLARDLRARRLQTIVLAGLTTDHAVSSSARTAVNLGFTTLVVSDATATFDREAADGRRYSADLIHQTALASLHGELAIVVTADAVLEGLVRDTADVAPRTLHLESNQSR